MTGRLSAVRVVLIGCLAGSASLAAAQSVPEAARPGVALVEALKAGLALWDAGSLVEAAESFKGACDRLAVLSTEEAKRDAGLSCALSALAFERAGSARAYDPWGLSVARYLAARTSWLTERDRLARAAALITARLQGATGDAPVSLAATDRLLLRIAGLGVEAWGGPRESLAEPVEVSEPDPEVRGVDGRGMIIESEDREVKEAAAYDTGSGEMVDAHGRKAQAGTGFSAVDTARLVIWLEIVSRWYPELAPLAKRVVARFDLSRLVASGALRAASFDGARETFEQEGRLGYEQYAASGLGLRALAAPTALGLTHTVPATVEGIALRRDTRDKAVLTSEPFVLAALELGSVSPEFDALAVALYSAQRRRAARTGILTAVSEDSLDRPPGYGYGTVVTGDDAWVAVDALGRPIRGLWFSTKAAMALAALHDDSYAEELRALAGTLLHSSLGFVAGRWDDGAANAALTLNTNAVVLEALLYEQRGRRPFLAAEPPPDPASLQPDRPKENR